MSRKIKHPSLDKKARIPKQDTQKFNDDLNFSFKYLDLIGNEKFSITEKENNYFASLLQRLKDVSSVKCSEFMSCRSGSLKSHPINWDDTTEPDGFINLNEQLRDERAFQFQISKNMHGRVHGLVIGNIFYVVWLDPNHALYN